MAFWEMPESKLLKMRLAWKATADHRARFEFLIEAFVEAQ